MSAHMSGFELSNSSVGAMSNYSVYFLRQNANLDINCSVYSLTSGSLQWQDYTTNEWSDNITEFLPAYYVANCSVPELWAQIARQNVSQTDIAAWLDEYNKNPYNEADNGDSFVALLFMLVGSCVSCWMLSLLFLLSPKHKQKPVLTQLAVLLYSVYLTVVFSQVARITESEYYADSLDMVRISSTMADERYAVLSLVSTLLTQLAFLQLFLKMTRHRWKLAVCVAVSSLIVATLITSALFIPNMRSIFSYVLVPATSLSVVSSALEAVFMVWFAVSLAHYTLLGTATPPKQVAYSKKLMPLAILTWFFIVMHIVQTILSVTLWRKDWLTNAWISYVPKLLATYILTTSWEWVHSIRHLESRLEIVDMLGRRISLEDVMDFSNDDKVRRTALRGRFASILGFFRRRHGTKKGANRNARSSEETANSSTMGPEVVDCGQWNDSPQFASRDDESSEYEVHYIDTDSWEEASYARRAATVSNDPVFNFAQDGRASNQSPAGADLSDSGGPTSGEIVSFQKEARNMGSSRGDCSSDFVLGASGSSSHIDRMNETDQINETNANESINSQDVLPPFRPHPGFSKDDYWDEK